MTLKDEDLNHELIECPACNDVMFYWQLVYHTYDNHNERIN